MNRILARQFVLIFLTAICLGCGADSATNSTGGFTGQIDARYLSDITPALQTAVTAAATRWTRALSKNLGDFPINLPANTCFPEQPPINETHHNLLLFISVTDIDGPSKALALTSVCRVSSRDTLPILSNTVFDHADLDSMDASGTLQGVVLHEMGHAPFFGGNRVLPEGSLRDDFQQTTPPRFVTPLVVR